jgi:hypothetical protein
MNFIAPLFKINKHRFNTCIFSIILSDLDNFFFIIIDISIQPFRDPTSKPHEPDLGRDLMLGTTDV